MRFRVRIRIRARLICAVPNRGKESCRLCGETSTEGSHTVSTLTRATREGPHAQGQLPPITYLSGGLESAHIRRAVCDILKGGERAFQERARRLRITLDR